MVEMERYFAIRCFITRDSFSSDREEKYLLSNFAISGLIVTILLFPSSDQLIFLLQHFWS